MHDANIFWLTTKTNCTFVHSVVFVFSGTLFSGDVLEFMREGIALNAAFGCSTAVFVALLQETTVVV